MDLSGEKLWLAMSFDPKYVFVGVMVFGWCIVLPLLIYGLTLAVKHDRDLREAERRRQDSDVQPKPPDTNKISNAKPELTWREKQLMRDVEQAIAARDAATRAMFDKNRR